MCKNQFYSRETVIKKLIIVSIFLYSFLYAKESNVELAKNDHIEVIQPEEMITYIENYQQVKPLFIFLSSEDGGCSHCDNFNQTIYEIANHRADNMNFVYVQFKKYTDIKKYPKIIKKYYILGMPTSFIIYENKVLDRTFGNTPKKRIETTIEGALQKTNGGVEAIIKEKMKQYLDAKSYKAMYVAVDSPKRYVYSISFGKQSLLDAVFVASKKCIKERMRKSLVDRCKLYMLEDEVVYEKDEKQIREIIKSLSPIKEIAR